MLKYISAILAMLMVTTVDASPLVVDVQDRRSIREIVADNFPDGDLYVGGTAHGSTAVKGGFVSKLLAREFDYITPANDFKQTIIHPAPNEWSWDLAFFWAKYARENNQIIRIHGPISPQASEWARDDERTSSELRANMKEYVTSLCLYASGVPQIRWIDVVNETMDEHGNWIGPLKGDHIFEVPWHVQGSDSDQRHTPLYIREAFGLATRYCDNVKLLINQHILSEATYDGIKRLVDYLRDNGYRVDGVSWQGHINTGWERKASNIKLLDDYIKWAHRSGLEFHITEFQSYVLTRREAPTKWNKHPIKVDPSDHKLRLIRQADTYRSVMEVLLKNRCSGVVAINFWHLIDSESQDKDGSMFNEDGSPRPSYYAVKDILSNPGEYGHCSGRNGA